MGRWCMPWASPAVVPSAPAHFRSNAPLAKARQRGGAVEDIASCPSGTKDAAPRVVGSAANVQAACESKRDHISDKERKHDAGAASSHGQVGLTVCVGRPPDSRSVHRLQPPDSKVRLSQPSGSRSTATRQVRSAPVERPLRLSSAARPPSLRFSNTPGLNKTARCVGKTADLVFFFGPHLQPGNAPARGGFI